MDALSLKVIARLRCDLPTKFGVPRQSGLASSLKGTVVFEPEFRVAEALRGIEDFSHIWLIWGFSEAVRQDWSPTVRPPRLGGNVRMGVFATRSPFRPNPIGLSSVRLDAVEKDGENGMVLRVSGVDLMDGTPIYDIKPYIKSADCHEDSVSGFSEKVPRKVLRVELDVPFDDFPEEKVEALREILSLDPRPAYQDDPERVYGISFGGFDVRFRVCGEVLTVLEVLPENL